MYLGMYPEDCVIKRDELARQWIFEGLVCGSNGEDFDDIARSYFNRLINRNLIQSEPTYFRQVISCSVHDMVIHPIRNKL